MEKSESVKCRLSKCRVAEQNQNQKPEPSEPFLQEPKREPEPSKPFFRNRDRNQNCLRRSRTTLNPKARKALPASWPLFPLYARAFFPVVRRFLCRFPTEQVLYYRNLGLYYGLASTTLPLYAKPRPKVKGGCVSCDCPPVLNSTETQKPPRLPRNRWNRKPKPLEPFHPETVTKPNRGHTANAALVLSSKIGKFSRWAQR